MADPIKPQEPVMSARGENMEKIPPETSIGSLKKALRMVKTVLVHIRCQKVEYRNQPQTWKN